MTDLSPIVLFGKVMAKSLVTCVLDFDDDDSYYLVILPA